MTELQRQLAERMVRVLRIEFDHAAQIAALCTPLECETYIVDGPGMSANYLVDLILKVRQRAIEQRYRADMERAADEADQLIAALNKRKV